MKKDFANGIAIGICIGCAITLFIRLLYELDIMFVG